MDSPQAAEESVKTIRPMTNTRLRPTRSEMDPAVSRNAASVSEYALTTHCRSWKLECSERWMSGRATLTTVMSSRSMKIATETAISVHHLRSTTASFLACARPAHYMNVVAACRKPDAVGGAARPVQASRRWRARKGTMRCHSSAAGAGLYVGR